MFSNRIVEDVKRLVKEVARKSKNDYIFEERESGVVVFPSHSDITDAIYQDL